MVVEHPQVDVSGSDSVPVQPMADAGQHNEYDEVVGDFDVEAELHQSRATSEWLFCVRMQELRVSVLHNEWISPQVRQLTAEAAMAMYEDIPKIIKSDNEHLWEIMAYAPQAILDIVETYLANFKTAPRESENFSLVHVTADGKLEQGSMTEMQRMAAVETQRMVWDFARHHSEFPAINQTLIDWVQTIQASDQSSNSTYTEYLENNKRFYEEYTKYMNTNAGTISPVDVDRVASIVRHVAAEKVGLTPSVYVGGPGQMDRFERKLFERMIVDGIRPSRVLAVDALDFSVDAARHARELDIPIEFRKDNFSDDPSDEQEQFDIVLYPWSIWCDVMKRLDVIRGMHATARRTKPGGIVVIDQPLPVGELSYGIMRAEQAVEHGEEGTIGRSYKMGAEGPELWKDLNVIGLADLCLIAAQAGLTPINLPTTVPELYDFMDGFERDEKEHIAASKEGQNTDAMSRPAYHTSGWNRVTIAFRNVGVEEALKQAHMGSSLLHELTSLRMSQPEDGLE